MSLNSIPLSIDALQPCTESEDPMRLWLSCIQSHTRIRRQLSVRRDVNVFEEKQEEPPHTKNLILFEQPFIFTCDEGQGNRRCVDLSLEIIYHLLINLLISCRLNEDIQGHTRNTLHLLKCTDGTATKIFHEHDKQRSYPGPGEGRSLLPNCSRFLFVNFS